MTTFDDALHPRATGGQFSRKTNAAPTGDLAASQLSRSIWVRTSSGTRKWMAVSEAHAQRQQESAYPDEAFFGIADPEVEVHATSGNMRVSYVWDGEGHNGEWDATNPDDAPLLRASVAVKRGDEFVELGSWCTATPAISDPERISLRASEVSGLLASRVAKGEDPAVVAGDWLERTRGSIDPVIAPPKTSAEIAAAFPERTEQGVVMGYYVTDRSTGQSYGEPLAYQEDADARCAARNGAVLRDHTVVAGPLFTPEGKVVIA